MGLTTNKVGLGGGGVGAGGGKMGQVIGSWFFFSWLGTWGCWWRVGVSDSSGGLLLGEDILVVILVVRIVGARKRSSPCL